ncbi:hypothetical protein P9139_20770 [Curtobacterium flaccumfaciens]|nr:hypothetical protein P9139_20770 [Curtobacterium flaccumfaciens]
MVRRAVGRDADGGIAAQEFDGVVADLPSASRAVPPAKWVSAAFGGCAYAYADRAVDTRCDPMSAPFVTTAIASTTSAAIVPTME